MQTDHFEDFINENKDQLDDRLPDGKIWKEIDKELRQGKEEDFWKYNWWKIAAIFLLFTCAFLIAERVINQKSEVILAEDNSDESATPDFQEIEGYYMGLIHNKEEEIAEYVANNDAELMSGFDGDLGLLDSLYLEHKEELKQLPNNDNVVNAMVENLKHRIEILNEQIKILEKTENIKEHGNISI